MARRKKQDEEQSPDNFDNTNDADDNFGLPEVEYEPLKREEPKPEEPEATFVQEERPATEYVEATAEQEIVEEEHVYTPTNSPYEEDEPSVWPKVLIFGLLAIVAGVAIWYFAFQLPKQREAEKLAKQEELSRQEQARLKEEAAKAEAARAAAEQQRLDSLAALKPAEGAIEALSGRTGRYYVVVASAIDDDLIMDYAKKLSAKGVSCKIIPPFGKTKFSRLAIDYKETYADAQSTADSMKGGDYGSDVWVVKY